MLACVPYLVWALRSLTRISGCFAWWLGILQVWGIFRDARRMSVFEFWLTPDRSAFLASLEPSLCLGVRFPVYIFRAGAAKRGYCIFRWDHGLSPIVSTCEECWVHCWCTSYRVRLEGEWWEAWFRQQVYTLFIVIRHLTYDFIYCVDCLSYTVSISALRFSGRRHMLILWTVSVHSWPWCMCAGGAWTCWLRLLVWVTAVVRGLVSEFSCDRTWTCLLTWRRFCWENGIGWETGEKCRIRRNCQE